MSTLTPPLAYGKFPLQGLLGGSPGGAPDPVPLGDKSEVGGDGWAWVGGGRGAVNTPGDKDKADGDYPPTQETTGDGGLRLEL